jgi:hypothetical protein
VLVAFLLFFLWLGRGCVPGVASLARPWPGSCNSGKAVVSCSTVKICCMQYRMLLLLTHRCAHGWCPSPSGAVYRLVSVGSCIFPHRLVEYKVILVAAGSEAFVVLWPRCCVESQHVGHLHSSAC